MMAFGWKSWKVKMGDDKLKAADKLRLISTLSKGHMIWLTLEVDHEFEGSDFEICE